MSLRRRQPDPTILDDPAAAGLDAAGIMDDPTALGDPTGGLPTDEAAAMPPAMGPEGDTGGLSNEDLAQLDLGAALPDDTQLPSGTDAGVDPNADPGTTLDDPAVAQLLDALNQGDPQAMQLLDLAARKRLAGA